MPRPLSEVNPEVGYQLAIGQTPFSSENALAAFSVINQWGQIDATLGSIVIAMMAASPEPAAAMFATATSGTAKQRMVFEAATYALDAETALLVKATVKSCQGSRLERNAFAHDIWGRLNTEADLNICVAARIYTAFKAKVAAAAAEAMKNVAPPEPVQLERSKIMVWQPEDFQAAARRATDAHAKIARLPFVVRGTGIRMRERLLQDPDIARRYKDYLRDAAN